MDGDWTAGAAEAAAGLSDELARNARIIREQAQSIAHYKKMYDRSSALAKIGVWECDLATEVLTWTDGVYDLFELPRGSDLKRSRIVELYEDESRREMERLRAETIRDGGSFTLDINIRTAKGNDRWLRLTADVERENGRPVRIFGTKQDITEEKAAREKVQSLQTELIHVSRTSAMSTMASTLAHELNQPLAAISNYVAGTRRALEGGKSARAQLEGGLEAIAECALRASNIIRSLRAMTSENAVRSRKVVPNPLIREAAALAAGPSETASVRFDLAEDTTLLVDPVQLQQVLINLIRNAFEALRGRPDGEIRIASSVEAETLELRVEDNGPGVAPALLDAVFDSFVSSKPGGMGVGLSISRTIVEAQGGRISAANLPGGGASFRITLPLAGRIRG